MADKENEVRLSRAEIQYLFRSVSHLAEVQSDPRSKNAFRTLAALLDVDGRCERYFLREHGVRGYQIDEEEYQYLEGLSYPCQEMVKQKVRANIGNLYDIMMDIIPRSSLTKEVGCVAFIQAYRHRYLISDKETLLVKELYCFCYDRLDRMGCL